MSGGEGARLRSELGFVLMVKSVGMKGLGAGIVSEGMRAGLCHFGSASFSESTEYLVLYLFER
eukprot:3320406-Rhodomonas_salina.1